MPNPRTSTPGKTGAKRPAAARGKDAVTLLKSDHRDVEKLFAQLEKASDEGQKQQLAAEIFLQLRIHTRIEEEIFYPTSREFLASDDLIEKSEAEHQSIKDMIKQLKGMKPADKTTFAAKLSELKEAVQHHVQEEENELFPQVQKTDMDLKEVGQQMMTRKKEVMAELGGGAAATH